MTDKWGNPDHLHVHKNKTKRPGPRFQAMMRALASRNAARAVDREPQPTCADAMRRGTDVYCTNSDVCERVGGSAVHCIGVACGHAQLPPPKRPDTDWQEG